MGDILLTNSHGHDIVAVGASAGGVEALTRVVGGLPPAFPAAVFVVLHLSPNLPSALAEILGRSGPLRATQAENQQPIQSGHIYVAPPNKHLVVHRRHMTLETGPRENNARPSVDRLFRRAARSYGRRVVGVVLSGTLTDGALGLAAIKMRGGVCIVQDPEEALFAGMPESALAATDIDYCLPVADISTQLDELTKHSLEHEPMSPDHSRQSDVTFHAADEPGSQSSPKVPNAASGLSCPECHGSTSVATAMALASARLLDAVHETSATVGRSCSRCSTTRRSCCSKSFMDAMDPPERHGAQNARDMPVDALVLEFR
jgi:two-component system chemotaxis response regulator CheB